MRFMVIGMATKESEAGAPPTPEAIAAMQKYNEELVGTQTTPSGIIFSSYKAAGALKTG